MKKLTMALALAVAATPALAQQTVFSGTQAQQMMALLNSGRGACFVTRSVVNPTTNAVEQAFCTCVARVDGTTSDPRTGQITAVVATMGQEHICNTPPPQATPTPTQQQRQNAANRITQIDNEWRNLDQFMQNLDNNYLDRFRYQNDPVYRGQYDQWKRGWGEWTQWQKGQWKAERDSLISITNAPQPGGGPPPAGTAQGGGMPGLLGVPMGGTR